MHVMDKERVAPQKTAHGEIIFELIGRAVTKQHSVAHITIPAGCASLKHYHPVAEESYYILAGHGLMILGEEERSLGPGEIVLIPPTVPHKIYNRSDEDLELLAICVPAWEPTNSVYLEDVGG